VPSEGDGTYADVNGVHIYYEVSGAGKPPVLLHGGFGGVHSFAAQVRALAERCRVFVRQQRGRGTRRTSKARSVTRSWRMTPSACWSRPSGSRRIWWAPAREGSWASVERGSRYEVRTFDTLVSKVPEPVIGPPAVDRA
jgi:pimeloyl-ACP methyl ester carboxylesterase